MSSLNRRILFITALGAASLLAVLTLDPIPQDPAYHNFADQRTLLCIPNFANVFSNLPLLLIGVLGLRLCRRNPSAGATRSWTVVFLSAALVSFGSAYYHWNPSNETLVWDRLPMTAGFMGLFIAITSEHVDQKIENWGLPLALAAGVASVLTWVHFDDLRWYGWIQFFPLITLAAILTIFPAAHTHRTCLPIGLGAYIIAKIAENYDASIYGQTREIVAGHALKHLLAAVAVFTIYLMLKNRRLLPAEGAAQVSP
ncbi:MAG: ceramidase [Beijerinckiaceae bacterium]|nr:ceramidase [Beijerinckiaceae bacterium]MCI0734935.1 ceramidase [Beijerinckiaceae bacterium]